MILSTAQRQALGGLAVDLTGFQRTAALVLPGTYDVDISDRVISWGKVRFVDWNFAPGASGELVYPTVQIRCVNGDSYLSPLAPGAVWADVEPPQWTLELRVKETLSSSSPKTLLECDWPVVEVRLDGNEATITAVHPLRRAFNARWKKEQRHLVQLNGYLPAA